MSVVPENSQHSNSEAVKSVASLRIERLKRDDDEEQWISGEELCTEGSSDEEDATCRVKKRGEPRHARRNRGACKQAGSPHKQPQHDSTARPQPVLIPPALSVELAPVTDVSENAPCPSTSHDDILTDLEEEQAEISWRPKRGSIKLPNLTLEGGYIHFIDTLGDDFIMSTESDDECDNKFEITVDQSEGSTKIKKPSKKLQSFVTRNIKLAGDGWGALALTNEEKRRLDVLLHDEKLEEADCGVEEEKPQQDEDDSSHTPFRADSETNALLRCIDLKLQAFKAERCAINIKDAEGEYTEENMSPTCGQEDLKMKHRLTEIEQALKRLKQSALEEIEPVPQEEISKLLKQYCTHNTSCKINQGTSADQQMNSHTYNSQLLPHEEIGNVVQNAKNDLPLFHFKY